MVSELYNGTTGVHSGSSPNSLPEGLPGFLDREAEILQIKKFLREGHLVTMQGIGGVGKTRLAIQVGGELRKQFDDGIFLVPFDAIASSELIADTVAMYLGIRTNPRLDPFEQLVAGLSSKNILLVLDDFEITPENSAFITKILEHAPTLKILVTANERLDLEIEDVVELHGLSMPERGASDAETYPAVQLFLQHARIFPDFEVDIEAIGHICRLVDGIPLAIELAAAWSSSLSCEQIGQRIEQSMFLHPPDVSGEDQSMLAIFDSVWELFSETERRILMGLSVYKGGFSQQAAAKITSASVFYLDALLNKLIIKHNNRNHYTLHPSFSYYLQEKLQANPVLATDMEIRHGSFYLGFLRDSEFSLKRSISASLLEDILSDVENIRLAWKRTVSSGNFRLIQSALSSWMIVLENRGWFREAIQDLEALSNRIAEFGIDAPETIASFIQVKKFQGELYYRVGDYQSGIRELQSGLQRINGNDFLAEESEIYRLLGDHYSANGQYDDSKEMYRHGLVLAEKIGNLPLIYQSIHSLGEEAYLESDYQGAISIVEHALEIARQLEDKNKIAQSLNDLGKLYYKVRDYPRAMELLTEALSSAPDVKGQVLKCNILATTGKVLTARQEYGSACQVFSQGLNLIRDSGASWLIVEMLVDVSELLNYMNEKPFAMALVNSVADHTSASTETKARAGRLQKSLTVEKVQAEPRKWNADQLRLIIGDVIQMLDQKSQA
jgi:tetratricopeptide (TPR) repeat protein